MDFISTFWEKEICMEDFSRYFINISVQVLVELAVIYMCCRITKISKTHYAFRSNGTKDDFANH